LPLDKVQRFDNAIRIYLTNTLIKEFNTSFLKRLDRTVIITKVINIGPKSSKIESRDTGNLYNTLPLYISTRVILIENIWTTIGLVNGATGYIHNI
ncbi:hypothetical protein B0T24DRAFT_492851, partial [Lasiosphaeria ovina]